MISYCQEVGIRGSLSSSLVPFVLYYYNDYKAYHQTAGRSGHQDSHLTNSLRSGTRESRVSSQGSAHVELETSEVEKLRIVVQQMIGESQAFLLDAIKSMLVEFKRDTGRSESGGAEGSAAVGKSPEGAGPTAVGQSPAEAGPATVRETILRDGGMWNFGEMGHGEAGVPVEVGPERDQPDQPGKAGEMSVYPSGGGTEPGIS